MISWDCIIQVLSSSYPPTISGLGVIPTGGEVLSQPPSLPLGPSLIQLPICQARVQGQDANFGLER